MIPEISVYLPNVPGQFSRVLKALASEELNLSGFSVDLSGAISLLRLLFKNTGEAERAKRILIQYNYDIIEKQLLLISTPDEFGQLLKVADILGNEGINVEYGYVTLGRTENGNVLFAIKVGDRTEQQARKLLNAAGINDHDMIPAKVGKE